MKHLPTSGRAATLVSWCLLSAACSDDAASRTEAVVRVVDGVTIVESPGLHAADSTAWWIDTIPLATIGMVEGPPEYVFGRIGGLLLREDGTILVADALARELRRYDASGGFLERVGGAGQGPGEFTGISEVRELSGDSIAVLDGREGSRIDVLSPDLAYVRRLTPRLAEMTARPPFTSDMLLDVFANGDPLMGDYIGVCASGTGVVCADSVRFFRTDGTGAVLARFGRHVLERRVSVRLRDTNFVWTYPHPQPIWAVAGDRFYYTDATRYEVLVFSSDGRLERIIRVAATPPRWSAQDVFPEFDLPADRTRAELFTAMREAQLRSELPDTFPAFGDLLVDDTGHIWALEYVPPSARAVPPRWYVFDPDGYLRYSVRSAPGVERSWRGASHGAGARIGDATVLAVMQNPLGVETAVLYRLVKQR